MKLILPVLKIDKGLPGGSVVKNLLTMQEMQKTWVRSELNFRLQTSQVRRVY